MIEYLPYIACALNILLFIINLVYTRLTGKSIDKGVTMKFKDLVKVAGEPDKSPTQSFSPLITQYSYNDDTGELEELPDKLDIQKLIDSHIDTSLEKLFEKYGVDAVMQSSIANTPSDVSDLRDKLDIMRDAYSQAEDIATDLGMSADSSFDEVYDKVQSLIDEQSKAEAKAKADAEAKAKSDAEAQAQLVKEFEEFKAMKAAQAAKAGDNNAAS